MIKRLLFLVLSTISFPIGAAESDRATIGFLVEKTHGVLIKRASWSVFAPAGVGSEILAGDLLRLSAESEATVLCQGFRVIWRPPPGELSGGGAGCKPGPKQSLVLLGQRIMWPRGREESESILAPRGLIREERPLLRWVSPDNERLAWVRIVKAEGGTEPIWGPAIARGGRLQYPDRAPRLSPRVAYLVQLKWSSGDSYLDPGTSFELLPNGMTQRLEAELEQLDLKLESPAAIRIGRSIYLASHGVYGEAASLLATEDSDTDSAALLVLRGNLLWALGLTRQATTAYESAAQLATELQEADAEIEAHYALALAARDASTARAFRLKAAERLQKLGDYQRAARILNEGTDAGGSRRRHK